MTAAVALGLYPDMMACGDQWVAPLLQPRLEPDAKLARVYDGLFPTYVAARQATAPVWDALDRHRKETPRG
jgi:erythritol kinase